MIIRKLLYIYKEFFWGHSHCIELGKEFGYAMYAFVRLDRDPIDQVHTHKTDSLLVRRPQG